MKGILQEKKQIGALLSSLPSASIPLGLAALQNSKNLLLNSVLGLG